MKKYILLWIDDEGHLSRLGEVETNDPKRVLFNKVSEFICGTSFFYDPKNPDNIWKGIKEGQKAKEMGREHYYYEANNHILSIMEEC